MKPRYLTNEEVIAQFGDPTPYIKEDGSVAPAWEFATLESIDLPAPLKLSWGDAVAKSAKVNKNIAVPFSAALALIHNNKEAWDSIDTYGGCYNWRPNRKNKKVLSRHSWGIAIDLDVLDNPQVPAWLYWTRKSKMHPYIIKTFEGLGFIWGGRFKTNPDPMHFEWGEP